MLSFISGSRCLQTFTSKRLGFSTLVIVLLFSNGLIFLYLGILSEYIGRTFLEVKDRPSFIVERTVNIKEAERTDEHD